MIFNGFLLFLRLTSRFLCYQQYLRRFRYSRQPWPDQSGVNWVPWPQSKGYAMVHRPRTTPQTLGFSHAQENAIWRNETCNGSLYPLRDTIHAPPSSTFPSSCRLAVIYRCIFELGAWPVRRPVEAPQFIIRGAWRYLTPAIDPKTRL